MAHRLAALVLAAVVLLFAAATPAQRHVPGTDPEHPRVQYADSSVSLNDRCIVRQNKLNTKIPPVYVNGKPVGFC